MYVIEKHEYMDNSNRTVVEVNVVLGDPPAGFIRFRGIGVAEIQDDHGRSVQSRYVIPLPNATTLEEAYLQFDAEQKKIHGDEVAKFARKLGLGGIVIAQPGSVPLGPNDKSRRRRC